MPNSPLPATLNLMEESYYKKLGALTLSVGVALICLVLAIVFRPRPSSVSQKSSSTSQPSTVVSSPEEAEKSTPSSKPSAPSTSSETKTTTKTYTVQPGDTLYGIAQKFGVSWEAIAEANNIEDATTLRVGQKLVIPQQ